MHLTPRRIGEGRIVENVRDGIADIEHHQAQPASVFVVTLTAFIRHLADAANGGEGTVEGADDLPQRDLIGGTGEIITAVRPAPALQQSRILERQEDLLKELDGNVFALGELADVDDVACRVACREIDQRFQAVFAAF